METILIKIFAIALALSQVTTTPNAIKVQFDRAADQEQVAELLAAGCAHMLKAFDLDSGNIDDLLSIAMEDSQGDNGNKVFRGINFTDLQTAYRQVCKGEKTSKSPVDLGEVIDFYNKAAANLPDHNKLKGLKLPGASVMLDGKGHRFAEVFQENQRRVWVPLASIPEHVRRAFIAAEDKRFYQHKGIDEAGLLRAFTENLAQSGRPQGGSTITQQVVKNLVVGDDLSEVRKIREMIVAARLESSLTKDEILELYLNSIYLGRGAWGIELAARGYFGKSAKDLTLVEGALIAGLTKGPNYASPDRHPARAQERLAYVLNRLREEAVPGAEAAAPGKGLPPLPEMVAYERPRGNVGYFVDQVGREAKSVAGINAITADSYTVRTTINVKLQRAVEEALQEGLWSYERRAGRVQFRGAETNLAKAMQRLEADSKRTDKRPYWQQALADARLPLYDVHWAPAVVVEKPGGKKAGAWRVGLADGRVLPISLDNADAEGKLALYDVVRVHLVEGKDKDSKGSTTTKVELRMPPTVQGSMVVLENKTGRVLAMTGGFSHALSQFNRATQAVRQPGSTIKPVSYLAALSNGMQPNTFVRDEAITLPPIGKGRVREQDYWSPKNYEGKGGGLLTMTQALENSRNLATVNLLQRAIARTPEASLDRVCALAKEAQIYRECERYYPFVLGAQPARPIDIAAFYAAIANEGLRHSPHVIDSIERRGAVVYRHDPKSSTRIASADRADFYQLKIMMQGVLARGTAAAISNLAPYVAGKTGTSENENDVWFVSFTNDVTVAIWIGYDNAAGKRQTLGAGSTGGTVAVPIFPPVIQAVWANVAPRTALAPPSPEAKQYLSCGSTGYERDERAGKTAGACLRINRDGRVIDTRYDLVSRDDVDIERERRQEREARGDYPNQRYDGRRDNYDDGYYGQRNSRQPGPYYGQNQREPRVQSPRDQYGRDYQTPQRVDPRDTWGNRRP
jgi:membrane carboxypeptidase/penicillin-binding protein